MKHIFCLSAEGKVISKDRVHPRLWKGSDRKFRFIPRQKNEIKRQNKVSNNGCTYSTQ